jgi:hypothetical protein
MKINVQAAGTVNIRLDMDEASKLCRWLEETTNPAPDPDADVPGKLEDMIREIITGENKLEENIHSRKD